MATVTQVGPRLGIAPTCAALGLPRATYYRCRRPRSVLPARVRSPRALSAGELAHHEAAGAGEVDLLLPLRDARRLQPLRGGLDGGTPGEREAGRAVHPRDLRPPGDRSEPAHDPCRPGAGDDLEARRVPACRP